jgi:hypothetical protein
LAGSDNQWEKYSRVIRIKKSGKEVVDLAERSNATSSKVLKRKRQKGTFFETSEGAESPGEDSNFNFTEALCRSPALSETKEYTKFSSDKILLTPEIKSSENIFVPEKTLEERIRELPEFPVSKSFRSHVHGEFCGHTTVIHENRIDFLCDGELHFVTCSGSVYPHKLPISNINPAICKLISSSVLSLDENFQDRDDAGDEDMGERCWHREGCGHPQVAHGDHVDYLVRGRLEFIHGDHVDDHGVLEIFRGMLDLHE